MRKDRFLAAILAILLTTAGEATAQKPGKADTVQYRQQETTLSDGTIVLFEIGAFGHIHHKQGKPTSFIPMSRVEVDGSFLRTSAFELLSPHDSIRYVRSVWIPNPEREEIEMADTISAKNKMGMLMSMMFTELGREANIPLNSSFDASSSMVYILELRDATTNRVLAHLDTARVFKDSKGELKWRHYKRGGSGAYSAIGQFYPASVYLNVTRIDQLPQASTMNHQFYILDRQTGGDRIFKDGWVMGPMVSYRNKSTSEVSSASSSVKGSIRVSPNPANEQVQLTFETRDQGTARIALINSLGQLEYSESITLKSGSNQHSLMLSGVPVGSYTLVISSDIGVPLFESSQLRVAR